MTVRASAPQTPGADGVYTAHQFLTRTGTSSTTAPSRSSSTPLRRATIRDVAELAGVSIATVSMVLNGKGDRIPDRTQSVVLSAAEQLGYHVNSVARSLRSGRVRTLAIASSAEDVTGFTATLLLHAAQAARANGYALLLLPDVDWRTRMDQVFASGQADGVILRGLLRPNQADVARREGRVVILEDAAARTESSALSVSVDASGSLQRLVEHLLDQGHTRLAYFSPRAHTGTRLSAYRQALQARGLPVIPSYLAVADGYSDEVARQARLLLEQDPRPTAVLCGTDVLAVGVYQAAAQLRLAIPTDLSVAAIGLHGISQVFFPALTAMVSPAAEMADTAVRLLVRAIEHPEENLQSVTLEAPIAFGGSTAPPGRGPGGGRRAIRPQ